MSLSQQLTQLQELPDPPLPSLSPQTWGWWALLSLIVVAAAIMLIGKYRQYKANAYRRQALADLNQLMTLWQQSPAEITPLRDLPGLLKRTALTRLGPGASELKTLSGDRWQQMLQRMASTPLADGFAVQLALLAYAEDEVVRQIDLTSLCHQSRHWLETHHDPV